MDDGDDDDEKLGNLKNEAAVEEVSTTEEAGEGEISFDEDDVLDTHEKDAPIIDKPIAAINVEDQVSETKTEEDLDDEEKDESDPSEKKNLQDAEEFEEEEESQDDNFDEEGEEGGFEDEKELEEEQEYDDEEEYDEEQVESEEISEGGHWVEDEDDAVLADDDAEP